MTPEEQRLVKDAVGKLTEEETRAFVKSVILEYARSPAFKKELQNARDSRKAGRRVL
jgi:hypothetical protein